MNSTLFTGNLSNPAHVRTGTANGTDNNRCEWTLSVTEGRSSASAECTGRHHSPLGPLLPPPKAGTSPSLPFLQSVPNSDPPRAGRPWRLGLAARPSTSSPSPASSSPPPPASKVMPLATEPHLPFSLFLAPSRRASGDSVGPRESRECHGGDARSVWFPLFGAGERRRSFGVGLYRGGLGFWGESFC